jgi:hypothetical protein
MAVENLITSCQQLNPDERNHMDTAQPDLDHLKSLYAARLAVCELMGAGAKLPDQCSGVIPFRGRDPRHVQFSGDDATTGSNQLASCLQALESKPQWWTSYSNNRQNAAVMCQAARIEIERDVLLNRHRNMLDITARVSQSLNQSLDRAETEALQHRMFVESLAELRSETLRNLSSSELVTRSLFRELAVDVEKTLRDIVSDLQLRIADVGSDTVTLTRVFFLTVLSVGQC